MATGVDKITKESLRAGVTSIAFYPDEETQAGLKFITNSLATKGAILKALKLQGFGKVIINDNQIVRADESGAERYEFVVRGNIPLILGTLDAVGLLTDKMRRQGGLEGIAVQYPTWPEGTTIDPVGWGKTAITGRTP